MNNRESNVPEKQPIHSDRPTPEALGGIYVRVEEPEDLTILHGQIPLRQLPQGPLAIGAQSPKQDACLNIDVAGEECNFVQMTPVVQQEKS
jgi:hypothetical protein